MKQCIKIMSIILLGVFANQRSYSYDFEVGGIYYGYNTNTQTAYVTKDYTKEQTYTGNIIIPSTVTYNGRTLDVVEIGTEAFSKCRDLYSVSLPNSIKTIGQSAFAGCGGIVSLSLPSSVNSIGEYAFSECIGMRSINIPDKLEKIENCLFKNCSSLENISLPNGLKDIGACAFQGCSSLKSVTIPSSVTAIRRYAFQDCSGIETLVFEDGSQDIWIEEIVSGASYKPFDGAFIKHLYIGRAYKRNGGYPADYSPYYPIDFSQTKILSLGESVKMINTWSESIETIYSFSLTPDKETVEFSNSTYINAKLYVPTGTKEKYMDAKGWKNFFNIIEIDIEKMWNGKGEPKDDEKPIQEKCGTPTIGYNDGKLTFTCKTEGAECVANISDTDIKTHYGNEISLTVTYTISVYATATGYENSDVATATLCWIDTEPKTEGIESGVAQVKANAVLIQSHDGTVSVEGVADGTDITIYDTSGQMVGSAKAQGTISTISTSLRRGNVAIVRIGDKSVKVVMQ